MKTYTDIINATDLKEIRDFRAEAVYSDITLKAPKGYKFVGTDKKIEIIDYQLIAGGIAVYVRAYDLKDKQYGFGIDGTTDIERFVYINPPTLVEDPLGLIIKTETNERTGIVEIFKYRFDPDKALEMILFESVEKAKKDGRKIIKNKVGRTTTTVYADTADGMLRASNASWATTRTATTSTTQLGTTTSYMASELESGTYNIYVGLWMFDTSVISSSDTINSATFSVYLNGDNLIGNSQTLSVGQSTQTTWNSLVSGDFPKRGYNTILGSSAVTHPTGTTSGYLDFALNSTGLAWIARNGETIPTGASASGKTQLSLIYSSDSGNTTPTARCYAQIRMAEQAGTTSDPKLVIDSTSGGGGSPNSGFLMMMM